MFRRCFRSASLLVGAIMLLALLSGSQASDAVDMTDAPKVQDPAAESPHSKATDIHTADRENVSMAATRRSRAGAKEYTFQAEVNRLMDILIHSLYSNKDIFLRELISNASDALDKIRFLSLTDKAVLGEGDSTNLDIRILLDKESNTLNIRDRGIGMTREDLMKNLGTIAKSGTSAFLEQMQKGGDVNLIGQFGVGFYSVYLVADWVEVVSKHNDDKQHIWTSGADGRFSIAEDTENEPLDRGTLIKIHLKPEAQESADEAKLRELVARYSEFINFPIYLMATKEVDVPVEEEDTDKADSSNKADSSEDEEEEASDEEGAEDVEDEEEEDDKASDSKPKTRKVQKRDWDLLNDNKALWLQPPGNIKDEEYQKFYRALSKDYADALDWVHFKAEGDVEFRSILFVPKNAPYDFYDKYYDTKRAGPKLYVRRVFISDDIAELLPRYLSFLRGVVDSDTLPLNVSREMLQAHAALRTIKKKLVRKVLDLIRKMAEDERKCSETKEGDEGRPSDEECGRYATFWREFGRAIKLGIMEDSSNRSRLAKLLRFHTSKSPDKLTSFDDYIGRMKEEQKAIYFVAAAGSKEEAANSPFLEALVDKGYEVIYFGDVLDEYIMQHLTEYDDHKFVNIAKDDLKLPTGDSKDDKSAKGDKDTFKGLITWWKSQLGEKVAGIKLSSRLSSTPCVVVTSKYGQSANMERIMRAQALSDPSRASAMRGQRTLEINPKHPLIVALRDKVAQAEDDLTAVHSAQLLYETALMESGFTPDDVKAFSQRMYELMAGQLASKNQGGSSSSSSSKDEL